jgi:UDP-N-acetylglucosamine--N-acetylmuramyl-(pentapeptide) pyrophosphoryl-undecaprenol N-acetylglucosamine transferase
MRVLLAAGGTGGHLVPAIRISEAVARQLPDAEFVFVGSDRGFEERVISARQQRYLGLPARGFSRRHLWRNLPALYHNWQAGRIAADLVREFRPDVAVGCGGYASYFPIRACAKSHIPYALQEQNRQPGLATKWLSRNADTVFIAFEETRTILTHARKIDWSGNPIDPRLATISREEARRVWNIPADATMVLITGGSTGARSINENIVRALASPSDGHAIHLLWQTGAQGVDATPESSSGWQVQRFAFTDKMTEAFVAADLIIARSGALTLSEICAAGRPAILVPYPLATGDHQYQNARTLVDAGGAVVIDDRELSETSLLSAALLLLGNPDRLQAMAMANRALGRPHAADQIAACVIALGRHS